MSEVPNITLHDGVEIPQLGFGVFQIQPDDTREIVQIALESGYRHIDTAAAYGNEAGVGEAIAASGIPREEIFVTTKLWNSDQGFDSTLAAFDAASGAWASSYIDLYLIHWPVPDAGPVHRDLARVREDPRRRAARGRSASRTSRIEDLERLEDETETRPAVNQIELHPRLQQAELRAWQDERGIMTEAWAHSARAATCSRTADRRGRRRAWGRRRRSTLRWHIQLGNIVFPKSVTRTGCARTSRSSTSN